MTIKDIKINRQRQSQRQSYTGGEYERLVQSEAQSLEIPIVPYHLQRLEERVGGRQCSTGGCCKRRQRLNCLIVTAVMFADGTAFAPAGGACKVRNHIRLRFGGRKY